MVTVNNHPIELTDEEYRALGDARISLMHEEYKISNRLSTELNISREEAENLMYFLYKNKLHTTNT